jgi:hypothetical protein
MDSCVPVRDSAKIHGPSSCVPVCDSAETYGPTSSPAADVKSVCTLVVLCCYPMVALVEFVQTRFVLTSNVIAPETEHFLTVKLDK